MYARTWTFQCSSASRKFLNRSGKTVAINRKQVSVLFSEPKIPQFVHSFIEHDCFNRFSALQRAENSSMINAINDVRANLKFQCSSASRKFLNLYPNKYLPTSVFVVSVLFSEPKIPQCCVFFVMSWRNALFQCSSASRKFLNRRSV